MKDIEDTVCIAAVCVDKTRVFAVLCSDTRVEWQGITSTDLGYKRVSVAPGVSIMFAGSITGAREMIERYRKYLSKNTLLFDDPCDGLHVPLRAQQRADAERYLSATLGMKYSEFIRLDAGSQKQHMSDMLAWKQYAQLLVVWSGKKSGRSFVRLFVVTDKVDELPSHAHIGVGANASLAALHLRNYRANCGLAEAVYSVYEAKRVAELVPGVGQETHMEITEFDPSVGKDVSYPLTTKETLILSQQYSKLALQSFSTLSPSDRLNMSFIPRLK